MPADWDAVLALVSLAEEPESVPPEPDPNETAISPVKGDSRVESVLSTVARHLEWPELEDA